MRYNSDKLEGTGYTKLAQVMQRAGYNEYDRFELGTVTSAAPDLRIKVDHLSLELDAGDVIVAEHLTDRTGTIVWADGISEEVTYKNGLKVGDRVIVSSADGGQTYVIIDRVGVYH